MALTRLLLALLSSAAVAHEKPIDAPTAKPSAAAAVKAGWDFTLPSLDGQRFVRLRAASGPALVNFWSVDCPPCVAELPLLLQWAADNPAWTLLLVGTDAPAAARDHVARSPVKVPSNVQWLRSTAAARALLREAGSPHGGLPHSVALQPAEAYACAARAGMVDMPWLQQLPLVCEARASKESILLPASRP